MTGTIRTSDRASSISIGKRGVRLPSSAAQNVALPFPFSSKRSDQPFRAGPYRGVSSAAATIRCLDRVRRRGHEVLRKDADPASTGSKVRNRISVATRDSHFRLAPSIAQRGCCRWIGSTAVAGCSTNSTMLAAISTDRWSDRSMTQYQDHGVRSVLASPQVACRHSMSARSRRASGDCYGHVPVRPVVPGRAALGRSRDAAGRPVFWDEYGLAGDAWDTHYDHFPRMVDQLCRAFDQALYGLLSDLDARGHARRDAGRPDQRARPDAKDQHSCRAAVATTGRGRTRSLLAGGGVPRGQVLGGTDADRRRCHRPPHLSEVDSWRRCTTCWGSTRIRI